MRWPLHRRTAAPPSPRPEPSANGGLDSRTPEELRAEFHALCSADQALLADVRVGCGARDMPLQQLADLIRAVRDRPSATASTGLPDQAQPADT